MSEVKTIAILTKRAQEEREKHQGIGASIRKVGIGDGVQFSSVFENFFHATGEKLIDVSKPWYLDHNPFVLRDVEPKRIIELWNYPTKFPWPHVRDSVYLSNAEIHASVFGIKSPLLTHPRLYRFEDFPFEKRNAILFHPFGCSHGGLPPRVIEHVLKKYRGANLYQIGLDSEPSLGIPRIHTENIWDLVEVISQARMLIGVDSGPAWLAACYPDVVVKKIRTRFQFGYCEPEDWVPLDVKNSHSFWDDQGLFKIYNCFENDVGFTASYRRL